MSRGRMLVREASEAYRQLRGLFCIYKPPKSSMSFVLKSLALKLTNNLNAMHYSRPTKRIEIEGTLSGGLVIKEHEDYSMHPLVVGPLFQVEDISLSYVGSMKHFVSGLSVVGVNDKGAVNGKSLTNAQLISTYAIEGKLGVATSDLLYTGAPMEKSSYEHVYRGRMERVLDLIQNSNRRQMVDQLGLRRSSQGAYEAVTADGLVRPNEVQDPMIYGIELIDLSKPHFTIEVKGINMNGEHLLTLINDIGLRLKTNAHTLRMRCIRHGPFTLDLALLKKHWTLDYVGQNIETCQGYLMNTEHEHTSLISVQTFKDEQAKLLQDAKEKNMIEQSKREGIALKMLEDFKANEEYEEFVKDVDNYRA